jgi:hypothetical protein
MSYLLGAAGTHTLLIAGPSQYQGPIAEGWAFAYAAQGNPVVFLSDGDRPDTHLIGRRDNWKVATETQYDFPVFRVQGARGFQSAGDLVQALHEAGIPHGFDLLVVRDLSPDMAVEPTNPWFGNRGGVLPRFQRPRPNGGALRTIPGQHDQARRLFRRCCPRMHRRPSP